MRRIFSTTLLAMGWAGLLHAAETASPASSSAVKPAAPANSAAPAAVAQAAASAPAATPAPAPATQPAAAPAQPTASPAAKDTSRPAAAAPKPDTGAAKPAPAKKLSKKARAAADSAAKADSLRAAAAADSLKAAQARAADSAQAAARAAAVADSLRADSARQAEARSRAADSARAAVDSAPADSATAKSKKRKRVVRETTVNTLDELKGRYRSPKKALFMSLVVPGLGQAYVGHSWFNYTRGAAYFMADVALAYGWHYYVGVKQDRQISRYQRFADANWRQWKYEDSVETHKDKSKTLNLRRDSYCEAVQSRGSEKGQLLFTGCGDPAKSGEYLSFKNEYRDTGSSVEAVEEIGRLRAGFPNPQAFYELIGKENEFITGWLDAPAMKMGDSAWYAVDEDGTVGESPILATTPNQQKYIAMRDKANDYARMQAWFLGGMVVNHIVSAVDAALSARYHNKALYQTETSWYDRLHLDSRIAWDGLAPIPTVTASFTF